MIDWISAKERLPEDCRDCLVVTEGKSFEVMYYDADIELWSDGKVHEYRCKATHWAAINYPEAK